MNPCHCFSILFLKWYALSDPNRNLYLSWMFCKTWVCMKVSTIAHKPTPTVIWSHLGVMQQTVSLICYLYDCVCTRRNLCYHYGYSKCYNNRPINEYMSATQFHHRNRTFEKKTPWLSNKPRVRCITHKIKFFSILSTHLLTSWCCPEAWDWTNKRTEVIFSNLKLSQMFI